MPSMEQFGVAPSTRAAAQFLNDEAVAKLREQMKPWLKRGHTQLRRAFHPRLGLLGCPNLNDAHVEYPLFPESEAA
jgi:hypothetical protein